MNGGNCQNCANSFWVQEANRFITNNRTNPNYGAHVATVEFLLQNGHCGINYRTGIGAILQHLQESGIILSREEFQNYVLTDLKREGVVATLVYPGPQGGVFIPCGEDEVRQVVAQLVTRVAQELTNIQGVAQNTRFNNTIESLRRAAIRASNRI